MGLDIKISEDQIKALVEAVCSLNRNLRIFAPKMSEALRSLERQEIFLSPYGPGVGGGPVLFDREHVRSRNECRIEELEARNAILEERNDILKERQAILKERLASIRAARDPSRAFAALVKSGIPLQAQRDPETTPPLRISVNLAREIMREASRDDKGGKL